MDKNPWTVQKSTLKYENNWIAVTEHEVYHQVAKRPGIYGTVHFKNTAIGILPLDSEGNTWLVGQYRFPIQQYVWEVPAGGGYEGTDPLEAAKKELREETGITALHWDRIISTHLSNSVTDEYSISYVATGLSFGKSDPDDDEVLAVRKLPFLEAYEKVLDGTMTDSLTVITFLKAKVMLDRGLIRF